MLHKHQRTRSMKRMTFEGSQVTYVGWTEEAACG